MGSPITRVRQGHPSPPKSSTHGPEMRRARERAVIPRRGHRARRSRARARSRARSSRRRPREAAFRDRRGPRSAAEPSQGDQVVSTPIGGNTRRSTINPSVRRRLSASQPRPTPGHPFPARRPLSGTMGGIGELPGKRSEARGRRRYGHGGGLPARPVRRRGAFEGAASEGTAGGWPVSGTRASPMGLDARAIVMGIAGDRPGVFLIWLQRTRQRRPLPSH